MGAASKAKAVLASAIESVAADIGTGVVSVFQCEAGRIGKLRARFAWPRVQKRVE